VQHFALMRVLGLFLLSHLSLQFKLCIPDR
jgi:hypothetical protein